MNCGLSHLLLAFRPNELAADDRAALDAHLRACPACAALAQSTAATDHAIRNAMLAVPVPDGLRAKLYAAVSASQSAARWRKAKVWGAGLAAMLTAGLVGVAVVEATKPRITTEIATGYLEDERLMKEKSVRDWLASEGLPSDLPRDFDYQHHAAHGIGPLGSMKVPFVLFQNDRGQCRVYVLRMNAVHTPKGGWNAFVGSEYSVTAVENGDFIYLIAVSTGTTLDAFLKPPPPVA